MAGNDFAVVVGINQYPDLGNLEGAETDAEEFRDWLLSATGGALSNDPEHVHLIVSGSFAPAGTPAVVRPTTVEVDTAFEKTIEYCADHPSEEPRRLYIFLAGHGIAGDLEDAALLMANATRRFSMGHHIPGRSYANWFRAAALFQEVVLLMDCCRDNYRKVPFRHPPFPDIQKVDAVKVRYFYGFATKWSRKARERTIDSQPRVRGLFSHAVLAGLRSGRITGEQLRGFVFKYMRELVAENEYQEPEFAVDPNNDIVFSEAAPNARLRVRLSFTAQIIDREVELLNDKFEVRAVHTATAQPWETDLEIGEYLIIVKGTNQRKALKVFGGGTVNEQL